MFVVALVGKGGRRKGFPYFTTLVAGLTLILGNVGGLILESAPPELED